MTFQSSALDYLLAGYAPFPTHGKDILPKNCSGRTGTVTEDKVHEWMANPKWQDGNTAIRVQGFVVLDVDEYDSKHGADQMAELEARLGVLPSTVSNTSRGEGPSRQHFFLIPDPTVELVSKAAPDVDVLQWFHRYALVSPSKHPKTGQPYIWYDAEDQPIDGIPDIGDFEILPDAWLEFLTTPAQATHLGHAGSVMEWLDTLAPGEMSERVRIWATTVPEVFPGHELMVKIIFNLVRLGAEGQPGIRAALDMMYGTWLKASDLPEYRKELDTALLGAIKKAGAREPEFAPLGAVWDIAMPDGLWELMQTTPLVDTPESYRDARLTIIQTALGKGMSELDVATVTRASVPGQRLPDDAAVWPEVRSAPPLVSEVTPAILATPDNRINLLTDAERAQVAEYRWFGTDYTDWTKSRVRIVNAPYHRLNRWMILSTLFSDCGVIPLPGADPVGCNLYMINLGDTTTGKTEALDMGLNVIEAGSPVNDRPDLGGDFSKESLIDVLTRRDGKPSLFYEDEADGWFEKAASGSYTTGMIAAVTKMHSGKVPTFYRQGNKEVSGLHAKTYFSMYLLGTIAKLTNVLDKSLWESGFLARYIWTVGEPAVLTDDMYRTKLLRGEQAANYSSMPRQWASNFGAAKARLGADVVLPRAMDMTPEAEERLDRFNIHTSTIPNGEKHADLLTASTERFRRNILKCVMLAAMSEGAAVATVSHVLVAVEQAEEWLSAMLLMIDQTIASAFSRQVDKMEEYVRKQVGQKVAIEKAYVWANTAGAAKGIADLWIAQLEAEGRLQKTPGNDQRYTLTLTERK